MGSRNPYIPSTYVWEPQICDIAYFYSVVSWISPNFLYSLFICLVSVSFTLFLYYCRIHLLLSTSVYCSLASLGPANALDQSLLVIGYKHQWERPSGRPRLHEVGYFF